MADVQEVANYFLHLAERLADEQAGDLMTPLGLQYMLYFAQGWHLARHGKPLFDSRIEARANGPAVPAVRDRYRDCGVSPLLSLHVRYDVFTDEEQDSILQTFTNFNRYSASGLRQISVGTAPWKDAFTSGEEHAEISTEAMMRYFQRMEPLEVYAKVAFLR